MSIRLCQACLHEVKEGDKLCSNCMISVNRHATVIEVMSEHEGFSYVSNRYAFHDENLNNYNADMLKETKNSRLYPDNIKPVKPIEEEEYEYVEEEDGDFTKNIVRLINSPKEYIDVIYGLLGCLLLLIGNFFTVYSNISAIKTNNSIYLNYITVFITGAACLAVLLVFKHKKKYVLVPTIIVGIMLIFVISDVSNFDYLGMGYYIMWISLILLVACASVNTKSKLKKYFLRKSDLTWIMLTFFVSLGLVNTFNYKFGSSVVPEPEVTIPEKYDHPIPVEEIKTVSIKETKAKLDISLLDTYLVRNKEKDAIVVEISVYNAGNKPIKVKDCIDVYIMKNNDKIEKEKDLEGITYFNISSGNERVEVQECATIFYAFYVNDLGDAFLNVINKEGDKTIINQILSLNQKFYVKEEVEPIIVGSSEDDIEEKNSYKIFFKKPSSWSDKVYAYVYYIEDNKISEIGKWPGKKMEKKGDMYTISYDKKWYKKAKVFIVDKNNNKNIFPSKETLGLKLEGNVNIMPNE